MVKNVCESPNVVAKFTATLMLWPVGRIFIGNISLGISQLRGPQDQPNPAAYMHIKISTNMEFSLEMCLVPETPVVAASTQASATCHKIAVYFGQIITLV